MLKPGLDRRKDKGGWVLVLVLVLRVRSSVSTGNTLNESKVKTDEQSKVHHQVGKE